MKPRKKGAFIVLGLYLFCAVYLVPVYPHFVSANELAHWVIVAGLVEHGTLDERWSEPLIGRLVDSTRSGAAIHSNKPPGLALVSAPGYLIVRALAGPPNAHNLRWYIYAMRIFGSTIPLILLGLFLIRARGPDAFALAALLFGTCLFFFGALLFSHALSAILVYLSFRWLFDPPDERGSRWRGCHPALAGAAAGLATLNDYAASIVVVIFAAVLLFSRGERRRLPAFLLGGLPFAILLGFFNRAMFGTFFTLSHSHEAWFDSAEYTSHGLWGVGFPTIGGLWNLLCSPSRGLFFYSPALLLALPGLKPRNSAGWARLLVIVARVLVIAGYPANHGGWAAGTRYLVLILPLVADGLWSLKKPVGMLPAALLCVSIVLCVLPALTFVFVPPEFHWVHSDFLRPLLARGFYTPNLGAFLVHSPWTVLPVGLAAIAAIVVALRGSANRALLGVFAGAAAAAIIVFLPTGLTPFLLVERQVVVETYFRPEGELAAASRQVRNPVTARELSELAASVAAARAYPPDDWPYLTQR